MREFPNPQCTALSARAVTLALILAIVPTSTALAQSPAQPATDTSNEALVRRLDELERSTREQIEALRRELDLRKTEPTREQERRVELEKRVAELGGATTQPPAPGATAPPPSPQDARNAPEQAGARERTESADPLADLVKKGEDLIGNVYTGERFKVRLGGSLRSSFQFNSTPVGDQVSKALLPDPTIPGGGDNAGRESFRALAGFSRVLLAVQGPTTLGGRTFGYVELDFARNLSGGESGAVSPNPRLRHAYLRWAFDNVGKPGSFLQFTVGQTGGYADLTPDTVDFAAMSGGLGVAFRRNPRIAVVYGFPVGDAGRFLFGGGIERPILGGNTVGGDLGNGDVSQIPIFSAGVGYESTRRLALGDDFGIGALKVNAKFTSGRFEERFVAGTFEPNFTLQTGFDERRFTARAVHGGINIERLGFNAEGRARTFNLKLGGVWASGEASHLDVGFDRRVVLRADGNLEPAHSSGGFVNPIFYLGDTLSVRWAGGAQFALDPNLPVVTGSLTNGNFRTRNWQSEASVWWTPGPFSFALAYNFTRTDYRKLDPLTLVGVDLKNDNTKIEFIGWFSF